MTQQSFTALRHPGYRACFFGAAMFFSLLIAGLFVRIGSAQEKWQ